MCDHTYYIRCGIVVVVIFALFEKKCGRNVLTTTKEKLENKRKFRRKKNKRCVGKNTRNQTRAEAAIKWNGMQNLK